MKKIFGLLAGLLLISCNDGYEYYPKVIEIFVINNHTQDTIYYQMTDQNDSLLSESLIAPVNLAFFEKDKTNYDLWLNKSQFENYISGLKIFKINPDFDTIYVSKDFFKSRSSWNLSHYSDWDFYRDFKISQNELVIIPAMFTP